MRVLLCGEGAHEVGYANYWCSIRKEYVSIDGWMQIICRRLLGPGVQVEFEFRKRSQIILQQRDSGTLRPRPHGHGAKALAARLMAARENCDVVIFMVDADSQDAREWDRKRQEIVDGFDMVQNGVRALACVPMSASESWLLSDHSAWLSVGLKSQSVLPAHPEAIWGARDDPRGNHPHRAFFRVCQAAGVDDGLEVRAQVAELSNLAKLRSACPISFGSFQDGIGSL